MATNPSYPLTRERNLILAALLVLAAAAWLLLGWQAGEMSRMGAGLTMGLGPVLFLAIWVTMMIAMMFPTAAPMILMFARINAGRRQQSGAFVPTWIFVAGYLVVWSLAGVVAYALAVSVDALAGAVPWLLENGPRIGGVAILLAGIYQLTPLKDVCLGQCRTPLTFIMTRWRDGTGGAFRMGLEHGLFCLGCCWLLFVILFPLGVMNLAVMAIVTVLIFAEKTLPVGRLVARLAAGVLIVYGAIVLVAPQTLPAGPPIPAGNPMQPMEPGGSMPPVESNQPARPVQPMQSMPSMPGNSN